jgi:nanoRNase/pAp phosphatase (c-di-AMP/oligoRNAs hydrolase)
MRIYSDNQGALQLTGNPEFHARSKHIDVQYHYTRELKEAEVIDVSYIPTEEMAADCLIKPLKRQKFVANLIMTGLREDTDSHNLADEVARSNKRT